jgi:hypothetical protein
VRPATSLEKSKMTEVSTALGERRWVLRLEMVGSQADVEPHCATFATAQPPVVESVGLLATVRLALEARTPPHASTQLD